MTVSALLRLARPRTLLFPPVGIISAALIASRVGLEAFPPLEVVVWAGLGGMLLNAGSNAWNQIWDLEADRINHPDRPLVCGLLSLKQARTFALITLGGATFLIGRLGGTSWIWLLFLLVSTWSYSCPPLRLRRRWGRAAIVLAMSRGLGVFCLGWSLVSPVWQSGIEPFWLGGIFVLYVLGTHVTKDLGDLDGDRAVGYQTLPVVWGLDRSVRVVAPFFLIPFLGWPLGAWLEVIQLDLERAFWLAGGLMILGLPGVWGLRNPRSRSAWRWMYLHLLVAHLGLCWMYLWG
ncbi:MAG: UbiA family prenyltransferase [Planctomycetota bacterium]|nr:UbiA family prenyltransferase [Planctomycetota bacterium]